MALTNGNTIFKIITKTTKTKQKQLLGNRGCISVETV